MLSIYPCLSHAGVRNTIKAKKEWLTLEPHLVKMREAEAVALRTKQEAEELAAAIAKAAKKADFMKGRIQHRASASRKDFIGRGWLAERLVSSLGKLAPHKLILISGIGGTGKSYFFDRLQDARTCTKLGGNWAQLNGLMLARHCCMHKHSDSVNAKKFLNSLIGQLLSAIKDSGRTFFILNDEDDEDKTPVDKLLCDHLTKPEHADASAIVGEVLVPAFKAIGSAEALGGKCVVLVDSLDEARTVRNNVIVPVLIELIQKSPDWLRWVATSRPDKAVKSDIEPVAGDCIELSLEGENQEKDIREYVETELKLVPGLEHTSEKVTVICKKAAVLFKYAVMAVKMIKTDPEMDVYSLPEGLDKMFMSYFTRKYDDKNIWEYYKYTAPMLAIMVSTYDAVPSDLVKGDRHGAPEEWAKVMDNWAYIKDTICPKALLTEDESSKGKSLMQFGHKSIVDFLQNEDDAKNFWVDIRLGHTLLADRCKNTLLKMPSTPTHPCMQYTLRHLVKHLCYLHRHPYQRNDAVSRPDPLQEAAHVVLSFDWLIGRLLLDKDTQGVKEDMDEVMSLLKDRAGDSDAELAECIGAVRAIMTPLAGFAVQRDPRQIMGRIMLNLISDTRAPVVELVKQARECKRFRWWYLLEDTLKMGGEGAPLTCIGGCAFAGERTGGMGPVVRIRLAFILTVTLILTRMLTRALDLSPILTSIILPLVLSYSPTPSLSHPHTHTLANT